MNNNLLVRKAGFDDLETIVQFNINMALETESKYLNKGIVSEGVKSLLRDTQKGFYLVAQHEAEILGSLMITTEWSDWRNGDFWWIQSVYVLEKARRQGIYSQLYEKVKELALASGEVCGIRLYVENNNEIAQKTYDKLGMVDSHYKVLEEEF